MNESLLKRVVGGFEMEILSFYSMDFVEIWNVDV